MRYRAIVVGVIALALLAAGASYVSRVHATHALVAREDDPNPVPASPVPGIHRSLVRPVPFRRTVLDATTYRDGRKPKVIIDPDGRGAVVGAQVGPHGFALYRPGRPPALISAFSLNDGAEDAQAVDIDGDHAPDIVIGGLGRQTYLLLNPLHHGCADVYRCRWPRSVIDRAHPSHDVVVGDVDRDGRTDVVTESGVYFNDGGGHWTFVGREQIPRDGEGTALADLTGNGILDILAPYQDGTEFARFVNPLHHHGDPRHDAWTVQVIDPHPRFGGNMTIATADIDGNGRRDILLAPMYGGGGLVWYDAPPDPSGTWHRHLIDRTVNFVHQGSLQPADFNGNGKPDIAFAEQDQSPTRRIGVFYNVDGDGSRWQLQVLGTNGGHNIKAGPLGHDDRPAIVSARHGFGGGPNPLLLFRDVRPEPIR